MQLYPSFGFCTAVFTSLLLNPCAAMNSARDAWCCSPEEGLQSSPWPQLYCHLWSVTLKGTIEYKTEEDRERITPSLSKGLKTNTEFTLEVLTQNIRCQRL